MSTDEFFPGHGNKNRYAKELLEQGKVKEFNELRKADSNWGPDLRGIKLKDIDLSDVDLRWAILQESTLENVIFKNAVLIDVNFLNSTLINVDFEGAELCRANFHESTIKACSFKEVVTDPKTTFNKGTKMDLDTYLDAHIAIKALIERDNPDLIREFNGPARKR